MNAEQTAPKKEATRAIVIAWFIERLSEILLNSVALDTDLSVFLFLPLLIRTPEKYIAATYITVSVEPMITEAVRAIYESTPYSA